MNYTPIKLSNRQLKELEADLAGGMTNREAEIKYGLTSVTYAKKKLGFSVLDRRLQIDWKVLHSLYVEQGLTIKEISLLLGCSQCAVTHHLKSEGIPARKKGRRKSFPNPLPTH